MKIFTDLETFMLDVGFDRIFRILIRRRPGDWTPREMDEKYLDQSNYVNDFYTFIKIQEMIELPDKDILIGYKEIIDIDNIDSEEFENGPIFYKKLSEIELSYFPTDMSSNN